jgi:hypothetical protein
MDSVGIFLRRKASRVDRTMRRSSGEVRTGRDRKKGRSYPGAFGIDDSAAEMEPV